MSLYITPTGSGDGSGSSWDNAATIDQISSLIAAVGPGGKILVRADQGNYRLSSAISITAGGGAGAPVTITGVDGDGTPMKVEIVGTRDTTWQAGDASGSEVFKLLEGADHLTFDQFSFRDIGNGAFRVGAPITDLTLKNMRAENVQRFFDNLVSGGRVDASITGLNIHDVTVNGYSKGAIRIQYNSSDAVIQDVIGDSDHVDGDNFAVGVALTGTVHDILFKRVEMSNARDTTNAYRNGDGFTSELGTYDITYDTVVASGNTDGGLDLKGQTTSLNNIIVLDNKHNLRLWGLNVNLTNVLSGSTNLHGSPETPGDVLIKRGATDLVRDSFFYETNSTYPIFDLRDGNLLVKLQDVYSAGGTFAVFAGGSVMQTLPSTGNTNYVAGTLTGDVMVGTGGRDILYGDGGNDLISGGGGNDQLIGGDGADLLDGGAGNDLMTGGAGDDTYIIDSIDDLMAEVEGGGTDIVLTDLSAYTLRVYTENLTFTGAGAFAGTGNNLDNVIRGGDGNDLLIGYGGNDVLLGGSGADRLVGGSGNDSYQVDAVGDVVVEQAGEGYDTVLTSLASYTLTDNVEALTATANDDFTGVGNALDNVVTGGNGNDTLTGGAGNDVLNGGGGRDVMTGGIGDDMYVVDNPNDVVVEGVDEGIDTVRYSYATTTLGDNVENLVYTGTGDFSGSGNELDNILTSGGGNDRLTGGGGNDTLVGGGGDDLLVGGVGDDIYEVDAVGDTVVEEADEGFDTVSTSLSTYLLGSNVEALSFIGTGNFSGTGNSLANVITAGSGDDSLDGGAGADVLRGGLGNDTYMVDADDTVVEFANGGNDTVQTALNSYMLGTDLEGLVFTGSGDFIGTGNGSANAISGGAGNDRLDGGEGDDWLQGGAGDDLLDGGAGDDTYLVDSVGDSIVERPDSGIDSVRTSLNGYVLDAALENLAFTGVGAFAGTGNNAANRLVGGAGDDVVIGWAGDDFLDGAAGDDLLQGGDGDDTYLIEAVGDVIVELAGEGNDTVVTTLDAYTLGDELERLVFTGSGSFGGTGNALANEITGGAGNDLLDGGLGDDRLVGGAGDDVYVVDSATDVVVEAEAGGTDTVRTSVASYQLSANVEGLIFTGTGSFSGNGNELANTLTGSGWADVLDGGAGADVLDGGAGDDLLVGGSGDDVYLIDSTDDLIVEKDLEGNDVARVSADAYTLSEQIEALIFVGSGDFTGTGNDGANRLGGGSGRDLLRGLGGNDLLVGGTGADVMIGGTGDDTYSVDSADDVVVENAGEGIDTVITTVAAYALGSDVEQLTFAGTGAFQGTGNDLDNVITGGAGNDTLVGGGGNDWLAGGAGADRMTGGMGDDVYLVDNVGDVVVELAEGGNDTVTTALASYTLAANLENLVYAGAAAFSGSGNAAANTIVGGNGNDTLIGLGGADRLDGGAGTDLANYIGSAKGVVIDLLLGTGKGGDAEGDVLIGIENVYGSWVDDVIIGNDAANMLLGYRGNDTLYGGGGNDSLEGQVGVDIAYGGTGDDTYTIDDVNDRTVEYAGEGNDTVKTWLNRHTLAANIENLVFIGSGGFTGTGNELANSITGGSGADYLAGAAGNDMLDGGAGSAADVLDGGAEDDVLEGRGGGDTLIGGTGTDTAAYTYSTAGITVNLVTGVGSGGDAEGDRLSGIENLLGSRYADTLIGDANANVIVGGLGNDVIDDGAGGTDTLVGGLGNDTYYVNSASTIIVELSLQGLDQVFTTLNSFVLQADVDDVAFKGTGDFVGMGNALKNVLRGGAGNDTLVGGLGEDVMIGGAGNDIYDIDNPSDLVLELPDEGMDTIRTTRAYYTLGANVENLVFTGTYNNGGTSFFGTGNALANIIIGSYQTDNLDGRGGADTLIGGLGDDVYTVDDNGDIVIEATGAGTDTVRTSLKSYVLGANLERLVQIGNNNFVAYGNDLDNIITTNAGNDVIYSGAGNDLILSGSGYDIMYGGVGDDTYRVDQAGDVVVEYEAEGIDLVRVSLGTYVAPANVENLTFSGVDSFNGAGNALANILIGGKNDDLLDGAAGADTLIGGLGNDVYVVDDSGDTIVEADYGGIDAVRTTLATYALTSNVEDLVYTGSAQFTGTGNALANTIVGGNGNDMLDGGAGADTLTGGTGDDTYFVDDGGDVVVEAADGGYDIVRTASTAYVLSANVEALIYTGTADFAGTGSDGGDAIVGGQGNDLLDGGAGADTLVGGLGNDIYVIDRADDAIIEQDGGGSDTVRTALATYALGSNLESLVFTGSGTFAGTGNALANLLTGGAANDVLDGGGGNDTLDGGAGADRLIGSAGDDLYLVDNTGDAVVELASGGTDTVRTTLASYTLASNVEVLSFTGVGSFTGTGNASDNAITGGDGGATLMGMVGQDTLYGGAGNDMLNGGYGLDVLHGGAGNDTLIGESHFDTLYGDLGNDTIIGDFALISASNYGSNDVAWGGDGDDTIYGDSVTMKGGAAGKDSLYGGNGDDMIFGDADAITGGTLGNDTLNGDAGNDWLYGDGRTISVGVIGGNDYLYGGAGDDHLFGGGGNDTFVFDARGFGNDVIGDFGQLTGNRDSISLTGQKLTFANLLISYHDGSAFVETPFHDTITLIGVTSLTSADFFF